MYYYIGEQSCRLGYRFVYNTKDKSCKYMSKEASWRLNIQKTLESKDVDIIGYLAKPTPNKLSNACIIPSKSRIEYK